MTRDERIDTEILASVESHDGLGAAYRVENDDLRGVL